jgi:sulfatase maturation enzyme AslB (radical SAM superfamily)
MNYKWANEVTNLQVDITSHCNARCGACIRNQDGNEVKEELPLEHFDMEVWERLAKEDTRGWFIGDLALNGNWGDPMMHPNLVEMLHIWTRYHPETSLFLHTNGSMRTKKFWGDLGAVCRKFTNHLVVFAVDGMEDTHSLYRRKTNFNKIIENIKAFTSNGGRANVTTTLFEHNKHQLKEIEQIAWDTESVYFTMRHSHGEHIKFELGKDSYEISGCYNIEPYQVVTETDEFSRKWSLSDSRDYKFFMNANDQLKVKQRSEPETVCPWYNDRQVQIDPWATVWPCCHVSLYGIPINEDKFLLDNVDASFHEARKINDLKKYNLRDILSNEWFDQTLSNALNTGSWKSCQNICGVKCGV